jgi:aminoglycoside 6'-N-acetyltransferase I
VIGFLAVHLNDQALPCFREAERLMIESCTSPDHRDWLSLRMALWPDHDAGSLLAEMKAFCADPARFAQFIALSAVREPQGFVEVSIRRDPVVGTTSSPVAFLEGIYVAPPFRRQGIARALVAKAAGWAVSRGCFEFASDAFLDNTASHAMHRALGFAETERVVYFRKDLRNS